MSRKVVIVVLMVAGAVGAWLIATSSPTTTTTNTAPSAVACATTVNAIQSAAAIAQAIVEAPDGTAICMSDGSYPFLHVVGATHRSYVTIRPAAGATATVAGIEVANSSFLRFQGLRMTEGFNMRDTSTGASHDYQFIENTFADPLYGIVLYGDSKPIKKVVIEKNYMHHVHLAEPEKEGKCNAGYASGQDVTIDYAEGVTITHNTFKQAEWHYIQGGGAGPEGVIVEHNLFEGHIFYPCSHLNVWQIWNGGTNDTFANNIVQGELGKPAVGIPLIFENGSAGKECKVTMTNTTVTNNLFIDAAASYAAMIFTTKHLVFSHNTVVRSEYGTWLDRSTFCGAGKDLAVEHNVAVETKSTGAPQRFVVGECSGVCKFDYNVSDDTTANVLGSKHYVTSWSPSWITTTWNPVREAAPPADYYLPRGLPFAAGYEGRRPAAQGSEGNGP